MINFEIKPQYYKEIHNAIIVANDECRLDFFKSGISSDIVDQTNVVMCSIDIPKKIFKTFEVKNPVQIGYDWLNLFETKTERNMFLNSKTNHKFTISQKPRLTDENLVTHAMIEYDIFSEKFELPDCVSIRKKPKVPLLDLPCTFELKKSFLKKIVNRGEYVLFIVVEDSNELVCSGNPNWLTKPILIESNAEAKGLYSTDHLKSIVNAIPQNVKEIKMSLSINYPCTIEFAICDSMVPVKYLLAPRIESE